MNSEPTGLFAVERVRVAYDMVADDYAARLPDTRAEAQLDLAMIDAFLAAVKSGFAADPRVLDAGCGAGRMSRHLADRGCSVDGVDLSPRMVAAARRRRDDLTFAVGSLTDLPYLDGSFAGVLLWYSIIHTPPAVQPQIFAEAARVLRPSGCVLVGFQSGSGTRDVSSNYRRLGHDIELHRHLFIAEDVAGWLEEAGLREVCRLVRRPRGSERDDQAFLLARHAGS